MNLEIFINLVKPFSMTSIERIKELYNSLEYIRKNEIVGDIVECGVWKGGNILGTIEYLNFFKIYDKKVWLYDTFSGMTEPENVDIDLHNRKAKNMKKEIECYSSLKEVEKVLNKSNFDKKNLKFIVGDVIDTLNKENNVPKIISLLRLDTDWYQSTKKELQILYPKLTSTGVLIVDDYGHWQGSKLAVEEYFIERGEKPEIKKIDYTAIKIIKK